MRLILAGGYDNRRDVAAGGRRLPRNEGSAGFEGAEVARCSGWGQGGEVVPGGGEQACPGGGVFDVQEGPDPW